MPETLATLADVLNQLLEARREELRAFDYIKHPVIIGDAYEGLTKSMLERSIPHGLNLSVKKGIIRNKAGQLSHQVDCMIVEGEGARLPDTEHWVYPSSQVVMYLEVKKRLYSDDLKDGLIKMAHFSRVISDPKEIRLDLARDAWHSIVGAPFRKPIPTDPSTTEEMVYHSLICESAMPARVILGYDGFASEKSLRNGLIELLGQKDDQGQGIVGPMSLPSLIVARQASIVKTNGMPYTLASHPFKDWTLLGSSPDNPLLILLEILWCRLTYFHGAPSESMGEDLRCELLDPLLSGRIVDDGWAMHSHTFRSAKISGSEWSPHELEASEYVVLNSLCIGKEVLADDPDFLAFLSTQSETVERLAQKLRGKRLAVLDGGRFILLTKKLQIGFVGGRWLAAEDHDGRFSLWAAQNGPPRGD